MSNTVSPLETSLRRSVATWSKREGVAVEVHCNGLVGQRISTPVQAAVKAFVAEGLNNIAAHASAGTASVFVRSSGGVLRVLIEDDGVGFASPGTAGGGLRRLEKLAADVGGSRLLESGKGKGTSIGLEVRI
ncbi:MAG TPA: hypothetical protein VNV65_04010 [Candidatus Solibacter sp.]|nr:hypothetical protein [Candidatus Solibacter sp.]